MTDEQDWDAAAADAGYLPTSDYVARWEMAREAAHEALKTAREMITEIKRLRALVEDAYYEGNDDAVHGYGRDWLGSDSYSALQPKEGGGVMIEPSNTEQATWSDVTRDYVRDLQIENERLRDALEESYALNQNYYAVAADDHQFTEAPAVIAQARAALQPKEG